MRRSELFKTTLGDLRSSNEITDFKIHPPRELQFAGHKSSQVLMSAIFRNETVCGMSSSANQDEAAFVSLMELLERITLVHSLNQSREDVNYSNARTRKIVTIDQIQAENPHATNWLGRSSNGIAIHTDPAEAESKAISELAERHTILKALATEIHPVLLKKGLYSSYDDIKDLKAFSWEGPCNRKVVVIRATHENRKFYGFGAEKTVANALEEAFKEFRLKLEVVLSDLPDGLKFIYGNAHSTFHWQGKSLWTDNFFSQASSLAEVDTHLLEESVWLTHLELPSFITAAKLLTVAKAISPKFQQLFWGPWEHRIINESAIRTEKLPPDLHIVG